MKAILCKTLLVATILAAGFGLAGCESDDVAGNTYVDSDGALSIEFLPSGKANVKMVGLSVPCSYTRSGKKITVTCNGASQVLMMNGDGSLGGPEAGLIGKLTRKK